MSLRVVHCVGFYFPDQVGGSEVYVRDLATALAERDIESSIIAATDGAYREYPWEGVPVFRYPAHADRTYFQDLVRRLEPDLFHLHSWTTGAGLEHLRQVAELEIPSVITLHVPAAICMRGTVLLEGKTACDGRIDEQRCAWCWAEGRGLPAPAARLLARLPKWTPPAWTSHSPLRRAATLVSARAMAEIQAARLHEIARLSGRIVVPSRWMHAALRSNGIAADRLLLSGQAAGEAFAGGVRTPPGQSGRDIAIGFVGRLDAYKGVQTLVEAVSLLPAEAKLRLIIAGSTDEPENRRLIEEAAQRDRRIELLGALTHDRIPGFLDTLDVLAVPSRCQETGPIVVLEAHAMGVPVMGADLGGITERIRDGVDGWLLPFDEPRAWAAAMQQAVTDPAEVARRAANSLRTRSASDIAAEMAALYGEIRAPSK
ncbi:MAG: glycosyltransferase [Reyranella sp.]|uniref:glycosyltransferase n=1 Tax=Reyranella sp. TaxID=1929291 RepID=UPI002731A18B|nr:glycosyltransferase [Reyranella sp.]MDP1967476.1 glycosyltransferase [Reyranella sp.]MDP2376454.1 glycosyltransferase [Reyranella sp.]